MTFTCLDIIFYRTLIIRRQTHSWVDSLRPISRRESESEWVWVSKVFVSLNPSEFGWEKIWWVWVRVSPVEENFGEFESQWALRAKYIAGVSLSELHVSCRLMVLSTQLQHYYQPYVGSRLYSRLLPHTSTRYHAYVNSIFINQRRELGRERVRRCLDLPPQTFWREVTDKYTPCESSLSIKRSLLNCKFR